MNCLEIRFKILQFLYGELTIVELAKIHEHLKMCHKCEVEREAIEIILRQVKNAYDDEPVADEVRQRVFARLEEDGIST